MQASLAFNLQTESNANSRLEFEFVESTRQLGILFFSRPYRSAPYPTALFILSVAMCNSGRTTAVIGAFAAI